MQSMFCLDYFSVAESSSVLSHRNTGNGFYVSKFGNSFLGLQPTEVQNTPKIQLTTQTLSCTLLQLTVSVSSVLI